MKQICQIAAFGIAGFGIMDAFEVKGVNNAATHESWYVTGKCSTSSQVEAEWREITYIIISYHNISLSCMMYSISEICDAQHTEKQETCCASQ